MDKRRPRQLKKLKKQMEIINNSILEERRWLKTHPPFKVDSGEVKPFPVY
jgi:hypothetical protein